MRVKFIKDEDFVNFKKPCMFIGTITCTFKCCKDANISCSVCQNYPWSKNPIITIDDDSICRRYLTNPLTKGIVFGGLEPLDQFEELIDLINKLRIQYTCNDSIIIYTGYNKDEVIDKINELKNYENIYIKFGRYVPNKESHFDEVLGVTLVSDNQYGEKIS